MFTYLSDYEIVLSILESPIPDAHKFLQLKSLEYRLLQYQLFEDYRKNEYGIKLSNVAQFIHSYLILSVQRETSPRWNLYVSFALNTIATILAYNKDLHDIPEFQLFSKFFNKEKQYF